MSNLYILDTNVLLHDPNALFAFQENEVILPLAVVEEIDNQKKRQDEIGRNARVVSQKLDALRAHGNLAEGVSLPTGGRLRIELNHQECQGLPAALDTHKFDNRILAVAHYFNRRQEGGPVLVTKDLNLRIKADVLGIRAEDFQSETVNYQRLYTGAGERILERRGPQPLLPGRPIETPRSRHRAAAPVFHTPQSREPLPIRTGPALPGHALASCPTATLPIGASRPSTKNRNSPWNSY